MSMMIHRHFDDGNGENLTKLADVTPGGVTEDDFDIHEPLSDNAEETTKRRGRPKKTEPENAD